jgi:transcriptional regulator with XRE-family HTH domain
MTSAYECAGLTRAEIEHLSDLVAAVESADPTTSYVAVRRSDVLLVVRALDRAVAGAASSLNLIPAVPITDEAAWLRAVGLRVRLARVARGESQAEVGGRSGVSRVTVGSIERGEHPAAVTAYVRLADALGMPLAELLERCAVTDPTDTRFLDSQDREWPELLRRPTGRDAAPPAVGSRER